MEDTDPSYRHFMLQWGPALKAGRNGGMNPARHPIRPASMGPGPKGREEPDS